MPDLKTSYLGIDLKNPIVIGASNLSDQPEMLKKLEQNGAAAIVFKSLFEEQIQLENLEMYQNMQEYAERHAEMTTLFPDMDHAGPEGYLMKLEKAKAALSIPVIASLNAVYKESWIEYAEKIEKAGADALELNFYAVPKDFDKGPAEIEAEQIEILKAVIEQVKIPVSVKLSPYYTNPLQLIKKMDEAGAKGFVLFNRLFQPDIDIDEQSLHFPYMLSNSTDNRLSLRYAGLLHGEINADISSNTGIMNGVDIIKMILAGASNVQVVSAIYKFQPSVIHSMLHDVTAWMVNNKYEKLEDFRGKLSRKNIKDIFAYKRAQYVDILLKSDEIFKKYPMI